MEINDTRLPAEGDSAHHADVAGLSPFFSLSTDPNSGGLKRVLSNMPSMYLEARINLTT